MAEILHKDLLGDDIHELRVTISSVAPSTAPKFVGQGHYDIVAKRFYVAQGTSLVEDWVTTPIPPFLIFADTRTISWTSSQVGDEVTYQANVEEAELILSASNLTDFSSAVLTLPEIVSLLEDQHTRLIIRTGAEPGGWSPDVQNGLELDPEAQKIKLSQDLSPFGDPTFNELLLYIKFRSPLVTLTPDGVPTAASMFLDADKGMITRGYEGTTSSFTIQNELGDDVLTNPVGTNTIIAPSLTAGINEPGVVHANNEGLLTTSKLVDADVDVAAAIQGTKIVPDFGDQDITTTGSLLIDSIDSNNNELSLLGGPENKVVNIATGAGYNTVNVGGPNTVVNISSGVYTTPVEYVTQDKNIIVNFNASGQDSPESGVHVQEEYSGSSIDFLDATWQSANILRYSVDILGGGVGDLIAGEYVRVVGFTNPSNNGTYKVLSVDPAYVDVLNSNRTDSSLDESGVAASASRLLVGGFFNVGALRDTWSLKAPANEGTIELKPQTANKKLTLTSESADDIDVKFNVDLTVDQDLQKSAPVEFSAMKISTFTTGIVHSDVDGNFSSSLLVDADVDAAAAIQGTKVDPDFGNQNIVTTGTGSFAALTVTGAEAPSGSVLSKSSDYGVQVRGIEGTSAEFRFLTELGTPVLDLLTNGNTVVHNNTTTDSLSVTNRAVMNGGQKVKLSPLVSVTYVASASDFIIQADTLLSPCTISLPLAATVESGTVMIVKDARSYAHINNIDLVPSGSDTIDGELSYTIQDMNASVKVVSDGVSRWLLI